MVGDAREPRVREVDPRHAQAVRREPGGDGAADSARRTCAVTRIAVFTGRETSQEESRALGAINA
ncbi:hypothetical protein [Streptomyces sp. CA2R106]|uniref:hypothetical protein n=1 Tax=Streptomyces sp. CA2R106 TaxID=3120153 RepID=UPI0030090A38